MKGAPKKTILLKFRSILLIKEQNSSGVFKVKTKGKKMVRARGSQPYFRNHEGHKG